MSHCTTIKLQAVAVRIHIHSLVTVCCVYLPPNDVVPQVDLNSISQPIASSSLFCSVTLMDTALCGGMMIQTSWATDRKVDLDHSFPSAEQRRENLFPCTHEDISLRSSHVSRQLCYRC
ncbi:hypothetical protein TNCV_1718511 [Trichonephila clavipes]|nr:hypothetical protein TNCV_1718511 [Trichonephila clavipes]